MLKKRHYLALGVVVLAALLILSLPQRATSRLKLAVGSLFLPLFGLLNTSQQLPECISRIASDGRGQETKWEVSDQFVFGFEIRKTRMLASFPFSIVKISSPKMRFGSSLGP